MASSNFIVDADLHGLVDGNLDQHRRSDILRRLAGSPSDRVKVEAWQGQNELLRSAFSGIDREPLPPMLDLTAKPQLQCIPANDAPLVGTLNGPAGPAREAPKARRYGATFATLLLIGIGMGGAWLVLDNAKAPLEPDATIATAPLRGSVDATLASRSLNAVAAPVPSAFVPPQRAIGLPTTSIPDLRAAGFSFTGAETQASEPASIQFRYQNAAAERVVVSVARAGAQNDAKPGVVRIGDAYSWRRSDTAYAIAGTPRPARLRAIAVALQGEE